MISASGKPIRAAALIKSPRLSCSVRTSEKKRANTTIIINFTSSDTCKRPPRIGQPALGAKARVSHGQNRDQRDDRDQIQDGRLIHDRVVVHAGQQEHQDEAQANPFHLVCVHAREMARMRRGPDFQHAYAADGERRRQQPPVIIANTCALLH